MEYKRGEKDDLTGVQQSVLQTEKVRQTRIITGFDALFALAGAEGLEPSARGFGDRCSTN